MEDLRTFLQKQSISFSEREPLSRHCSFKIGGNADFAIFPAGEAELITLAKFLPSFGLSPIFIGNGSNVLFPDEGLPCVIFLGNCKDISISGDRVTAACGASLKSLCDMAANASLSGLEFAFGIPGTVGGAVLMNAGAYGGEIADVCVSARWFDPGDRSVRTLVGAELDFSYRNSFFQKHPGGVILTAEFALKPGNREEIERKMKENLSARREKQPLDFPSAGSAFKRPVGSYAAKLIEDAGLKGERIGGAEVSTKHAGFIVNRGDATASDVLALMERVRTRVLERSGISLESEIRLIR